MSRSSHSSSLAGSPTDSRDMDLHHILPQIHVTPTSDRGSPDTAHSHDHDNDTNFHRLRVPDLLPTTLSSAVESFSLPPPFPHVEMWWSGRYDFAAKIILLGDYGVGKTTLLATLGGVKGLNWCRCVAYKPNEYVELECVKNDKKILVRIMDTGGQERFRSMTSSYFRGAQGCLLMFDVTNEDSFNNVINWFNDIGVYAPQDNTNTISAIVLGVTSPNTSSPPSSRSARLQRRVSAERGFRLAESLNLTYCEANARDAQMVLCVLTRLVNNVIVSRSRRQSLAITIMPPLGRSSSPSSSSSSPSFKVKAEKRGKKRWLCCRVS